MAELTYTRPPKTADGETRTNEAQCLRQSNQELSKYTALYPGHPSTDLTNTEQDDHQLATAMVLSHKAARINQRADK